MRFYAPSALSERRSMTPEGFLIVHDVALAQVGTMPYSTSQIPLPGINGRVDVTRDESVLFHPEAIASFEGKPFTNGHPPTLVTADNHTQYGRGHVQNVRRGADNMSGYLVGDIMIKDSATIDLVKSGKVELSCGYDAAYESDGPGKGRQTKIIGNHVALVDKGRCGPTCYLGDEIMTETTIDAETKGILTGLKNLFGGGSGAVVPPVATFDSAAVTAIVNASVAPVAEAVANLTAAIAKLTPTADSGETDADKAARLERERIAALPTIDAAYVTRVASAAEILAPGTKIATHDSAGATDAVKACQCAALRTAHATATGKAAVETFIPSGVAFNPEGMTKDQLDAAFFGASAFVGALNNNVLAAMAMNSGAASEFASASERAKAADQRSQERWGKTKTAA